MLKFISDLKLQVLTALENLPAVPEGELRPNTRIEQEMEVDDQASKEVRDDRTAAKISKGIVTGNFHDCHVCIFVVTTFSFCF